ncbi:MAG TPA: DUF177 domain-containing protein [Anaerolineae bacterium]|nr:DUF177 domain-containing protein [Anaerolineae bacterium]
MPGGAFLNKSRHPLRLNVGFLLHKNVGYSRNFDFDHPSIRVGEDVDVTGLRGSIQLTRTAQGVYAQGHLQARISLDCVRCLSTFDQLLTVDLNDLFHYPPLQEGEPTLSIPEDGNLDFNPLIREYLLLDIPIQPLCHADCKGFCAVCGGNLNETVCDHEPAEIDPRLAALKSLLSEEE